MEQEGLSDIVVEYPVEIVAAWDGLQCCVGIKAARLADPGKLALDLGPDEFAQAYRRGY